MKLLNKSNVIKGVMGGALACSLLTTGTSAFAGAGMEPTYAYRYTHAYFNKADDPHTLAGAIYAAMKKDPVKAQAAFMAFMISDETKY